MTYGSPQNYILFRTKDLVRDVPEQVGADGKMIGAKSSVISPVGTVVATHLLHSVAGVTTPDGFAYAPDKAAVYPIGSIYTSES